MHVPSRRPAPRLLNPTDSPHLPTIHPPHPPTNSTPHHSSNEDSILSRSPSPSPPLSPLPSHSPNPPPPPSSSPHSSLPRSRSSCSLSYETADSNEDDQNCHYAVLPNAMHALPHASMTGSQLRHGGGEGTINYSET